MCCYVSSGFSLWPFFGGGGISQAETVRFAFLGERRPLCPLLRGPLRVQGRRAFRAPGKIQVMAFCEGAEAAPRRRVIPAAPERS